MSCVTRVADLDSEVVLCGIFSLQYTHCPHLSSRAIHGEGIGVGMLGQDFKREHSIACSRLISIMGQKCSYLAAWDRKNQ